MNVLLAKSPLRSNISVPKTIVLAEPFVKFVCVAEVVAAKHGCNGFVISPAAEITRAAALLVSSVNE